MGAGGRRLRLRLEGGRGTDCGGTSSTYEAAAADVGKQLTVTVTGTKANWNSGSATSGPTAAVAPAEVPSVVAGAPTIKGKAKVGKTLTALPGTWGPAPVTFTYQWLRNGKPIAGATGVEVQAEEQGQGQEDLGDGDRRQVRLHLGERHLAQDQEGQEEEDPSPRGGGTARLE